MADSDKSPEQLKGVLRRAAMARRDALPPDERMAAALAVAEQVKGVLAGLIEGDVPQPDGQSVHRRRVLTKFHGPRLGAA